VVEFQESPLVTTLSIRADERALPAIAIPDGPANRRRDVGISSCSAELDADSP